MIGQILAPSFLYELESDIVHFTIGNVEFAKRSFTFTAEPRLGRLILKVCNSRNHPNPLLVILQVCIARPMMFVAASDR